VNILKSSFISVDRNKRKSIVLFFILLIIFNLIVGALLISRKLEQTAEHFYRNMPNQVGITQGHDVHSEPLSLEALDQIRDLPYVRSSRYGLVSYLTTRLHIFDEFQEMIPAADRDSEFRLNPIHIWGLAESNILEFEQGIFELGQGRFFSNEEINELLPVIIIPEAFAELNGLSSRKQNTS